MFYQDCYWFWSCTVLYSSGLRTIPAQIEAIQCFTNQIERATNENKTVVIVGDANLCSEKWNSPTFHLKQVADELKNTLVQCGLHLIPLGVTYIADRLNPENQEITSARVCHHRRRTQNPRQENRKQCYRPPPNYCICNNQEHFQNRARNKTNNNEVKFQRLHKNKMDRCPTQSGLVRNILNKRHRNHD